MTQLINEGEEIFVNVNSSIFKFIDIPEDGNCYYHTVLKNHNISNQFTCVQDIRNYLCKYIEQSINHDLNIQKNI